MTTDSNANIIQVTDDSFDSEVLSASGSVLVDFWAPWCGPCKAIAPVLEELAGERSDLRIAKVNIDENTKAASQYNVRAIPTLLLFRNGEVVQTVVGAVRKADLENMLNS